MKEHGYGQETASSASEQVFGPLTLNDHAPLLRSKTRWIYQHPKDPALLIKIHIPRQLNAQDSYFKAILERLKDRFLYFSGIQRDFRHYIESRYLDHGMVSERINPIHGVVQTDLGLGLLVAAARDSQGRLAPTLRTLFEQKALNASRIDDLKALLAAVVESPLTFADLNLENIVLSNAGSDDEYFVIIDGLGDRTWIPIQRWVKWVRQTKKKEFQAKVYRYLRENGYE